MNVNGVLNEITDTTGFIESYVVRRGNPTEGTFRPIPGVRVHLSTDWPLGFSHSFIQNATIRTTTNSNGGFLLSVPRHIGERQNAYLIAYRVIDTFEAHGYSVSVYGPIYRSETFRIGDARDDVFNIYVLGRRTQNQDAITQRQVTAEANAAAESLEQLDRLSATITAGKILVTGSGRGGTVTFELRLRPSTTENLNEVLRPKIDNFDIDLPSIDFITTLCVDEDKIRRTLNQRIASLVDNFSDQVEERLVSRLSEETGISENTVRTAMNATTITAERVRYPVLSTHSIPIGGTWRLRGIAPDIWVGLPRNPYA